MTTRIGPIFLPPVTATPAWPWMQPAPYQPRHAAPEMAWALDPALADGYDPDPIDDRWIASSHSVRVRVLALIALLRRPGGAR